MVCKRIVAFFICLMLLFTMLTACASGRTVLRYGRSEITEYMYQYFASSYKWTMTRSIASYSDTSFFWSQEVTPGQSILDYLNQQVLDNVKKTLVCADLFDKFGLRLSDTELAEIDEILDTYEKEYADGSRTAFNNLLADYGVNRSILREIFQMESKVDGLSDYLFAEGGELALTKESRDRFYEENYVRIRLIFINDAYVFEKNEQGLYLYDQETGQYMTRDLTEEEKSAKAAKIQLLDSSLTSENFETLEQEHSEIEDYYGGIDAYPQGYYLTRNSDFISDVVDASFELLEGQITKVSGDYGTFFLKRMPLEEKGYELSANADFFSSFNEKVKNDVFVKYLTPFLADVEVDMTLVEAFSLDKVKRNSRF